MRKFGVFVRGSAQGVVVGNNATVVQTFFDANAGDVVAVQVNIKAPDYAGAIDLVSKFIGKHPTTEEGRRALRDFCSWVRDRAVEDAQQ